MPAYSIKQMPVKITVNTTISDGENKETYELTTFGEYYHKTNSIYLRYQEYSEEGDIQTTVKMGEREGSILRNGAIKMRLLFQKNKSLLGSYTSPFGLFEMKTKTSRIDFEFDEAVRKGSIDLLYNLTMQGSHAGTYHLLITFEEDKNEYSRAGKK